MPPHGLMNTIISLSNDNCTPTEFFLGLLRSQDPAHHSARDNLVHNVSQLLDTLFLHPSTGPTARSWVHHVAKGMYMEQVTTLTGAGQGFRFNAKNAVVEQIEGFDMDRMVQTMQLQAPQLWDLVGALLTSDPQLDLRRVEVQESEAVSAEGAEDPDEGADEEYWANMDELSHEDLFENSAYGPHEDSDSEESEFGDLSARQRKRRKAAVRKREAVHKVRRFAIICIMLVSTNQKCNAFAGILGFFYHSKNVPEKVIEALHHLGLSDSAQSIRNAVNSMSKQIQQRLFQIGRTMRVSMAYDNFDINFKTESPTKEKDSVFIHAASATLMPLEHGVILEDLKGAAEIYAKAGLNHGQPDAKVNFTYRDLMPLGRIVAPLPRHSHARLPQFGLVPKRVITSPPRTGRQRRQEWHVLDILVSHSGYFQSFKPNLGRPEVVDAIPVKKTSQFPLRAMQLNQSTIEGNSGILDDVNRQRGIGAAAVECSGEEVVEFGDLVSITHGDLSTLERLQSLQQSRKLCKSAALRFENVVFVLGLFHLKMAAADALWRTYIEPKKARYDPQGVYNLVARLRPKETGKFASGPGFRRMHDVVHHITQAAILDCWRLEAGREFAGCATLESFAGLNPTWAQLQTMAERIVDTYVAGASFTQIQSKAPSGRDQVFENSMLRNRDFLDYIEFSHAMNWGDVGRIQEMFLPFIFLFRATGKHKYSAAMVKFLTDLHFVYPARLRQAILKNWLVNPSGQPDGFRAVDWLVELNNLYTKVIYGGKFSNRTLKLMVKQSPLIEVFRAAHQLAEQWLHLQHRTKHHTPPSMGRTISMLGNYMAENDLHVLHEGRGATYAVPDQKHEGMHLMDTAGG